MKRTVYTIPFLFLILLLSGEINAQDKKLFPFEYGEVTLDACDLKERMEQEKDFYMNLSNDDLLKGFRVRSGGYAPGAGLTGWYGADIFHIFGQLLSGYSRMYAATGDETIEEKATYLYREWSRTIDADGYFFYSWYTNDRHYTFEKTLCGVIDYYFYCNPHPNVLECMSKITDWAIDHLDRTRPLQGFYPGEWYTLSENLYRAYLLTGDQKYFDFGKVWEYPDFWEPIRTNGNPFKNEPALHAYSHLNTLSGAALAYEVTGDKAYLDVCTMGYDFFRDNQCFVTGGFGVDEKVIHLARIQELLENSNNSFEVHCSCWACFKLGKSLISFTGDARYGDWIELLMLNGMLANIPMTDDGKNYHYANYNPFGAYKTNHTDGWWCCAGTRLQAFADIPNLIWYHDNNDLYLNLFFPSHLNWKGMKVSQQTDFPKSNKTKIVFEGESSTFRFSFREPEWLTSSPDVTVNGTTVSPEERDNWLSVNRTWQDGDYLEIEFPMEFTLHSLPKGSTYPAAMKYGPVAMVVTDAEQYPFEALNAAKISQSGNDLIFRVEGYNNWKVIPYYTIKENQRYCMYMASDYSYKIEQKDIRNTGEWNEYAGLWVTNHIGNSVEANFKGTGIRWKGYGYDDAGMVDVYIDGEYVATVDQYNSKRDSPFMWEKQDLEKGEHTIKLILTDKRNPSSGGNWMNYIQLLYYSVEDLSSIETSSSEKKVRLWNNTLCFNETYVGRRITIYRYNLMGRLISSYQQTVSQKEITLPETDQPHILVVAGEQGNYLLREKVFR